MGKQTVAAVATARAPVVVSLALIGIASSLTYASGSTLIASSYRDESGGRTKVFAIATLASVRSKRTHHAQA